MDIFRKNYTSIDINDIQKYIQLDTVQNEAKLLVGEQHVKHFLIAFYIYGYWQDILGDKLEPIYFMCKHIVTEFQSGNITEKTMLDNVVLMDSFIEYYVEYEMKNKLAIINSLLLQYFDIKNTLNVYLHMDSNDSKDTEIIDILLTNLKKVYGRLQQFDSHHIITDLESNKKVDEIILHIKLNMTTGFEYVGDEISIVAKRLYWDSFTFDHIGSDFEYIKTLLKSCTPNRTDLHNEYNTRIDIDFIEQQIRHDVYNINDFNLLMNYVFDKIRFIDSDDGIQKIMIWYLKWNKINKLPTQREEIIPLVMRDITNRLEKIYYLVHGYHYVRNESL